MSSATKTFTVLVLGVAALLAGCKDDIFTTTQTGYRGTGMVQIDHTATVDALKAKNVAPPPEDPAEPGGKLATEAYQNVQVLTDLTENEFVRIMTAMTNWVAPEQGCNYCHNPENPADDSVYAKGVARKMIQMVRHINKDWGKHVGTVGVTCYTCHRGNPVPQNIWFNDNGPLQALGMAADRQNQNLATATTAYTSLPYDSLMTLLNDPNRIRVLAKKSLVDDYNPTTKQTESTYALMLHMSQSLGVNCTLCHNTRAFSSWEQSTSQRITAWYGLRMVPELNKEYLETAGKLLPANRLGPLGDVPKVGCGTCHQGVSKPLYGAQMVKDYVKELSGPDGAGTPPKP